MSNNYDNWERLVAAVLRREQDREVALADSRESSFRSISSSSRFEPDSSFHDQNPQLEPYNSNTVNLLGDETGVGVGLRKIVFSMLVNDCKSRVMALKTAIVVPGVQSVAITGAERNQMVVIGDGIDIDVLCWALKKMSVRDGYRIFSCFQIKVPFELPFSRVRRKNIAVIGPTQDIEI